MTQNENRSAEESRSAGFVDGASSIVNKRPLHPDKVNRAGKDIHYSEGLGEGAAAAVKEVGSKIPHVPERSVKSMEDKPRPFSKPVDE